MTHENFHKKNTQLINDGFQRFRATEDCGTADCQFYGQKTTHFHCRYPPGRLAGEARRPRGGTEGWKPGPRGGWGPCVLTGAGTAERAAQRPAWWEQGGASSRPHVAP